MQRLRLAFVVFIVVCSSLQCTTEAEPQELPAATQEGKNTLGFKVDGEVWLPKGKRSFPNDIEAIDPSIIIINGTLSFGITANNPTGTLQILVDKIQGAGSFAKPTSTSRTASFWNDDTLYWHAGQTWKVTFTRVDTVERIVSGLFEFDLVTSPPQALDTVHITDGRFDIKF